MIIMDDYPQQIQEMRTKLAKLEDQETQQRLAFCDDHERFMPSTLCPEIKVSAAHHSLDVTSFLDLFRCRSYHGGSTLSQQTAILWHRTNTNTMARTALVCPNEPECGQQRLNVRVGNVG